MLARKKLFILIAALLLITLACGLGGNNGNNTEGEVNNGNNIDRESENNANNGGAVPPVVGMEDVDASLKDTEFGRLLAAGTILVESVQGNSADEDTFGPVLTVTLTNTSEAMVTVVIPCGLVFAPTETEQQTMMVVQSLEISIAPGESVEVTPFVVCIDIASPAPGYGSEYKVSYMVDGDLLVLAECVCKETLVAEAADFKALSVQFAAWEVAVGGDFTSLLEEEGNALEGLAGGDDVNAYFEAMMEMLSGFGLPDWLAVCGIELE